MLGGSDIIAGNTTDIGAAPWNAGIPNTQRAYWRWTTWFVENNDWEKRHACRTQMIRSRELSGVGRP